MDSIIAIANQKGGVGKTTTAVNLAAALATLGHETLLIDMDPQGNATSGVGLDKRSYAPNLYNVLVELLPLEKTIKGSSVTKLSVAGANSDLAGAEVQLVNALARESRLRGAMPAIKDRFRFAIIDCPPSLGLLTINALNAADRVIVPIQGEYYAMEGLAQFIDAIQRVQTTLNPKLTLEGGILTMFDSRMTLSNQVRAEVQKFLAERLFGTVIPRNIRLAEAPGFGKTIFQYDPRSKGAEAYLVFAHELLARLNIPSDISTFISQPQPQETTQ